MELKQFIERAEKCVGSQKELGERLGQSPSALRSAKAGIIGLPNYACVLIADLIGEDKITVIAASELVTEKKEQRRQIWESVIARTSLALLLCITSMGSSFFSSDAQASEVLQNSVIQAVRIGAQHENPTP